MATQPPAQSTTKLPVGCIVVGYDRHPASAAALVMAGSIASAMNARLHVVHVVDLGDAYPNIDDPSWEALTQAAVDEEQRVAESAVEGLDVQWTYQTARGETAQVLARTAMEQDALMIVIGERRLGRAVVHLLELSVLHHLLRLHPTTPVLIVSEEARPKAFRVCHPT